MTARELATELERLCGESREIENVTVREAQDISSAAVYIASKALHYLPCISNPERDMVVAVPTTDAA